MERIEWKISVPIFKNTVILKQLGIVIGIPFGIIVLVIGFASDESVYGLGLIGALLFFTWLFIMIVYRGKYEVEFVFDDKGLICRTLAKQTKKNKVINTLAVIFGLFTGNPAVAGAGMLAQSKQEVSLRWNRIKKVKYLPRGRTIMLRGGLMESVALFCTKENYKWIEQAVRSQTKHLSPDGESSR
ncbi:MAG: hypothetical protein GX989_00560 [Firmicutes bacterium]|nr:hypothetical protein [Bacillota bacterium]